MALIQISKTAPQVASESYNGFFDSLLKTHTDKAIPDKIFLTLMATEFRPILDTLFGHDAIKATLADFVKGESVKTIYEDIIRPPAQEFASLRMAGALLSGASLIGATSSVHLGLTHFFYQRARAQFQGCNSLLKSNKAKQ